MKKNDISLPVYLFHDGTNFKSYEILGCHKTEDGFIFRVWAPNAIEVSLVCDQNNWTAGVDKFTRLNNEGIWELCASSINSRFPIKLYDKYKFAIKSKNGNITLKADPYAFFNQTRTQTASIIYDINDFEWTDKKWINERKKKDYNKLPMNIYEVHIGSWLRNEDNSELSYREIAVKLADYLVKGNYTHVEFMPLSEYPFDGSWGYQVCGFYSPTSRYGQPKDLMFLVDYLHSKGIGVILDWVPAHFCKDLHGLIEFDGECLYENPIPSRKEHANWGTRIFDYARNEVSSFLISNALFWLNEYHFDALRVDAVASMLYLDYDKRPGEWIPNIYGGRENLEAIAFFKKLSKAIQEHTSNAILIAEESTSFAHITKKGLRDSLGFDFKWNMGWMNDIIEYIKVDPLYRKHHHDKLTFSMMYAYQENYILPFSHDEVVHLKKSMLDKVFGKYEDKFGGYKTLLAYMFGHPGKKLNFMGYEFGQFSEWNYQKQLDWQLLNYPSHQKLNEFINEINKYYLYCKELYINDENWEGFNWVVVDDTNNNVLVFERKYKNKSTLFVCNFSYVAIDNYSFVTSTKHYDLMINSDSIDFGGSGYSVIENLTGIKNASSSNKTEFSHTLRIPSNCCLIYRTHSKKQLV